MTSYRLDSSGQLEELSTVPTGGDHACHLALTGTGNQLLAANYGSGSVSSFEIDGDGALGSPIDVLSFTGSGPDEDRQDGPHPHQVLPVDDEVLVCDLGTDRIHRLRVDASRRFSPRRGADPPAAGLRPADTRWWSRTG